MAYTPYEWTVNSYLNPTRMNAIEQGIAAASQAAESASGEFHTIEELIGTQSIAGIGDGTLTGATWKINNDLTELSATVTTLNSNLTWKKINSVTSNSSTLVVLATSIFSSSYKELLVQVGRENDGNVYLGDTVNLPIINGLAFTITKDLNLNDGKANSGYIYLNDSGLLRVSRYGGDSTLRFTLYAR